MPENPTITTSAPGDDRQTQFNPPSPPAPSYSPITPEISISLPSNPTNHPYEHEPPLSQTPKDPTLNKASQSTQLQELPPPVPISESTNTDAIALRAAMSILQNQRQQAVEDMQTLQEMKKVAIENPQAYAEAIGIGNLKSRPIQIIPPLASIDPFTSTIGASEQNNGNAPKDISSFTEIPSQQNVVRMPPINWAKYQIVGQPLEILHGQQKARPVGGQPRTMEDLRREMEGLRGEEAAIARPYDPAKDDVGEGRGAEARRRGMGTRSGGRKG